MTVHRYHRIDHSRCIYTSWIKCDCSRVVENMESVVETDIISLSWYSRALEYIWQPWEKTSKKLFFWLVIRSKVNGILLEIFHTESLYQIIRLLHCTTVFVDGKIIINDWFCSSHVPLHLVEFFYWSLPWDNLTLVLSNEVWYIRHIHWCMTFINQEEISDILQKNSM